MKRIFLVMALALLAVMVSAQNRYYYDSDHKYGLLSNWTLGVSGQYGYQNGKSNVGINALATKRIGDFWRLRYSASINGLKPTEAFDRYGTALAGISLDFVEWAYLFADGGVMVNPSTKGLLGLAADAGLGLNVNFGQYSLLYAEAGADRVQFNSKWTSTVFARLGYAARLGITERDRKDIDIKRHNAEQLGELKQQNSLLKTDLKRQQEANDTLMALQNRSIELLARLEKRLDECNAQVAQADTEHKAVPVIYQVFFGYASAEITDIEAAKIALMAKAINETEGSYVVAGYCSNNGGDDSNLRLSEQRAAAVFWQLVAYGVDENRLFTEGHGKTTQYDGGDSPLNQMVTVSPR